MSLITRFIQWLATKWRWQTPHEVDIERVIPITPTPMEPTQPPKTAPVAPFASDRLYQAAVASLGRDMSPRDLAPDTLACAESLNGVYQFAFGIPIGTGPALTGTRALYQVLLSHSKFEQIYTPEKGCVIINPTGYSSKGAQHGHCGVVGNFDIMSNDSATGKWTDNYTKAAWKDVFEKQLGFPTYYFRPL